MTRSVSTAAPRIIVVPTTSFQQIVAAFGRVYCRTFHRSVSRPVGGKYRCWKCLREFKTDFR